MDRGAVLGRLARLVALTDRRKPVVVRLCEAARVQVGARGSSISINSDDNTRRMTLAATDDIAARLEELQEILGEGPCRAAYRHNRPVVIDLGDSDGHQWPAFVRSAREAAGDVTVHCFPVRPAGHLFGAFTVYAAGELSEPAEVVQFLADALGAAVLRDPTLQDSGGIWTTRSLIHQATGMVVVQLHIPPEDALAIIRAHAFAHDATVREIAERIVNRRLDFRENT